MTTNRVITLKDWSHLSRPEDRHALFRVAYQVIQYGRPLKSASRFTGRHFKRPKKDLFHLARQFITVTEGQTA